MQNTTISRPSGLLRSAASAGSHAGRPDRRGIINDDLSLFDDTALIVAFLQGKQTSTVEFFGLDADPNKLAASWRVYFDDCCKPG